MTNKSNGEVLTVSWWSLTKRVLFSPRAFFAELNSPPEYPSSVFYLAKTALVVSLTNTLALTTMFYVVVASFASILSAFMVIFGVLLTPLIAVAANIPPDKVPAAVESLASGGGAQVAILSAKLGAFLFACHFGTIVISTCLQAGIAHGIARLLGCAGSFRITIAAYSFGSAAWLLTVIPAVNVVAPIYGAVLDIFGMRHAHQLTGAKATIAVVGAAAVPIIAFIAYSTLTN